MVKDQEKLVGQLAKTHVVAAIIAGIQADGLPEECQIKLFAVVNAIKDLADAIFDEKERLAAGRHFLPGTKVVSVVGERIVKSDRDGSYAVSIEPGSVGTITEASRLGNGNMDYRVLFPNGIVRSITEKDFGNPEKYRVGTDTHPYPAGMRVFSVGKAALGEITGEAGAGRYAVRFQPHNIDIVMEGAEIERAEEGGCPRYKVGHEAILAFDEANYSRIFLTAVEGSPRAHFDGLPEYARIRINVQGADLLFATAAVADEIDQDTQIASALADGVVSVDWLATLDVRNLNGVMVHESATENFSVLDCRDTVFGEEIRDLRIEVGMSAGRSFQFWIRGRVGEEDFIRSTPIDIPKELTAKRFSRQELFDVVEIRPAIVANLDGDLSEMR